MEKVYLITGAAGHLASWTIRSLKNKGFHIRGLILPSENGTDDELIEYYKGDITKPETMTQFFSDLEDCDVTVIHMAGIVSISGKTTPLIHNVNVEGTRNVIALCKKYNVKRLLYVSSVHAIPEPETVSEIREIKSFSADAVLGAYAKTKAEATRLVMEANGEGLDCVVVHPSGIIGPGDNGSNHITQLMRMYINHKLPFGVKGGFDFVDVRDVALGIVSAAENGRNGECYLLSNVYLTVRQLIDLMRIATGRHFLIPMCPMWLAGVAAWVAESAASITKHRPLFTSYSLYTLRSKSRYSHEKATVELGYKPRDISQTIGDTIRYVEGCKKA